MPVSSNNQTGEVGPPPDGLYRFLESEIAFERSRKQEIFAWASSLLVAMIGGIVVLTSIHCVALATAHKLILTGATLTLGELSCYWIKIHWETMIRARKRLSYYYDYIAEESKDRPWRQDYTSIAAILTLALMAILALFFTPVSPCTP